MTEPLKVLFYDLETAPLLAHIWSPYDDYVTHDRLVHPGFLLTWSAQWLGEKKIVTGCLTGDEARDQDDRRIVAELAELIRDADIIVANMERWRWMPRDLGKRHIRVNIADFSLKVIEDGQPVLEMPVIVGRPYRRTPVFSSQMTAQAAPTLIRQQSRDLSG
mgnify:CR=1 FL=1